MLLKLINNVSGFIYDLFISTFFTIAAHLSLINHMTFLNGYFLDVGCGTGKPLLSIVNKLKQKYSKVIGVDLHPQYTEKAINLFKKDKQVEIYNMDFYTITENFQLRFNFIFFSFSFMLMPDRLRALQKAKQILANNNSKIAFVLTLNKDKNSLLARLKPIIKHYTSVDFGNVVYEDDFYSVISQAGLEVTKKVRVKKGINLLLHFFPVYYIECEVKST